MPPLDTSAHISEILICVFTAGEFLFTLATLVVMYRIKSAFFQRLDRFNKELEQKFVLTKVYEVEHPHQQIQRRHAQ